MVGSESRYRFYSDLAQWWPLVSPPEEYTGEAAYFTRLLQKHPRRVRTVLELGSGGGSNAVHMSPHFELTLTDLSSEMLAVSRALNPALEHLQGDMRTLRLGRAFDAVLLHDAIDYMVTETDLRAAMATAFAHCAPGGVAVFVPDRTRENYVAYSDVGGSDAPDGRGIRFLDWSQPAEPGSTAVRTEYVFVARERDGRVEVVHETHTTGLFGEDVWMRLLTETGFRPQRVIEETDEDRPARTLFVATRPAE